MNRYRCEWRINIIAEGPEEAVQKAEELMRGAVPSCWTVIDQNDGSEQVFEVIGRAVTRRDRASNTGDSNHASYKGKTSR